MPIKKIEILGLRGFSTKEILEFAIPNGNLGSGLTCIVGSNNSGKSTVFEALRAISSDKLPSFTEGKRNKSAGDKIEILVSDDHGESFLIKSVSAGSSEVMLSGSGALKGGIKVFTLASRRNFNPFFNKNEFSRLNYIDQSRLNPIRNLQNDYFAYRLFKIQKSPKYFNDLIKKVLGYDIHWTIDQHDSGQYYLKFTFNSQSHNSDGSGDGILSLFTIADALYDSNANDVIFIDEPELSLHPSLQKRLLNVLEDYSKDRQILIATHSPYFISWKSLKNGGQIIRLVKDNDGITTYHLSNSVVNELFPLTQNLFNPHILGLEAKEIFFLEDNIILVEGQEDVLVYKRILEKLGIVINGNFFGWGIGGADNSVKILKMLGELGYKKIAVIFDKNKENLINDLQTRFGKYLFMSIPTEDVRAKEDKNIEGLYDIAKDELNESHKKEVEQIFNQIITYFNS